MKEIEMNILILQATGAGMTLFLKSVASMRRVSGSDKQRKPGK